LRVENGRKKQKSIMDFLQMTSVSEHRQIFIKQNVANTPTRPVLVSVCVCVCVFHLFWGGGVASIYSALLTVVLKAILL
jgi:hypothetical protein